MACYVVHMLRRPRGSDAGHGPAKGSDRRGFGRLRQERSGRWSAAYTGPDAQVHRAPATFEYKDGAIGWLSAERKLIDLDAWTAPEDRISTKKVSGQTFGEFADDWLEHRRTRRGEPLKARTKADYRRYLDRHLLPALGDLPIKSLTERRVESWFENMNAGTPTERAHAYQLLRAICTTATERKVFARNPCRIEGAGRVTRAKRIRPADLAELESIAANMPDRLRLAVLLGAWCAMRYGEIAELRRKDIDIERGVVMIRRGVTWPQGEATVSTPKSEAGVREVHVPPHILDDLGRHLEEFAQPGRDGLLFPSSTGHHIHPRAFGWQYHQARVRAGRPDLRFHDLRHTGAVLAAQTGATLAELMARLGHSTPGAAMRYQHAAQDRDKAIAAALSQLAERR